MPMTLDDLLVRTHDVCGGRIRIDGTRITVHRIATLYKQGQSAEDIKHTLTFRSAKSTRLWPTITPI